MSKVANKDEKRLDKQKESFTRENFLHYVTSELACNVLQDRCSSSVCSFVFFVPFVV